MCRVCRKLEKKPSVPQRNRKKAKEISRKNEHENKSVPHRQTGLTLPRMDKLGASTTYLQCAFKNACEINGANKSVYQRGFGRILARMRNSLRPFASTNRSRTRAPLFSAVRAGARGFLASNASAIGEPQHLVCWRVEREGGAAIFPEQNEQFCCASQFVTAGLVPATHAQAVRPRSWMAATGRAKTMRRFAGGISGRVGGTPPNFQRFEWEL